MLFMKTAQDEKRDTLKFRHTTFRSRLPLINDKHFAMETRKVIFLIKPHGLLQLVLRNASLIPKFN